MCDKCKSEKEESKNFQCICGRQFEKKTSLTSHHGYCKAYKDYLKEEKYKCLDKPILLPNGKYKCQNPGCQNEHDGSYGSGRFCSKHCRCSYVAKKVKTRGTCQIGKHKRAPYGTWKCEKCNLIFETRKQLQEHNHSIHPIPKGSSWNKGLTKETDKRVLKYCKTYKYNFSIGKFVGSCKGKHWSEEQKKKISESMIKFRRSLNIATTGISFTPSYNKASIQFLDKLSKEMGWNLQHAENGREYTIYGYFLDAYDKEKNIVVEYDEPRHYKDVENNVLIDDDIERQTYIIEHLHCQFYRYNEKTGVLWKVE